MNWHHFILFVTALVLVFFESSFPGFRTLFGAQVAFLPALMVYTALTYGTWTVAGLSVVGGLAYDSLSANPLGVSILPLFLVGFTIFQCQGVLLRDHPYAQFCLGAGASVVAPLITLFLLRGLETSPLTSWGTAWQMVVMAFGGGLFAPFCFIFFDRINRSLNYQLVAEIGFRSDRQIKRGRT